MDNLVVFPLFFPSLSQTCYLKRKQMHEEKKSLDSTTIIPLPCRKQRKMPNLGRGMAVLTKPVRNQNK